MDQTDTDGGSNLQPLAPRARAPKSRRRSGADSSDGPGKDDTTQAENSLIDLEIELSILQSSYERCLSYGLKARVVESMTLDGSTPVLTIQMLNVSKCPNCEIWIPGLKCPTC